MASGGASGYHQSFFWRVYDGLAQAVDHRLGWDRLPTPLGILVLIGTRDVLRKRNLFDTAGQPAIDVAPVAPLTDEARRFRTEDGTYNDLAQPSMGMVGSRFGRNVPIEDTFPEPLPGIMEPSPREVSRSLMTRDQFQPATAANALAASWLQFMIRDWFSHGKSPAESPWQVPLRPDDPWPENPMPIMRTRPDPTRPPGPSDLPPSYQNTVSPWWDASSIYGANLAEQQFIRTGVDGKLHVRPDGSIPYPTDPQVSPTMVPGFWLGLAMLHSLFAREHNAICDMLKSKYPALTEDELFGHARLVNAALMAKIHTVEWTPTVIAHPTTRLAMRVNWWGLTGERLHNLIGRISRNEVISGIPGSPTEHYGVPYSLTEEFVAVYRMHPLVPDDYSLRSTADDGLIEEVTLRDLAGPGALAYMEKVSLTDLFYSFGTLHPGLVTLHNFPRFLQEFVRPDGKLVDMAALDILRAREQGVPRYNEFRRLLHLKPARTFAALTDNPVWAEELRKVYGDIEQVDLMSGMYAERRPEGFAFSDTAFRVFVLMASRRLNSDRFFTDDYRREIYTKAGMGWIDRNSMVTVLQRHHPELKPAMRLVKNAFAAWQRAGR
ncbi:MAG: heme peroxidase [Actinomycetota bacterium]|nr:heme peroxidase [Actinomycetota bacterium]